LFRGLVGSEMCIRDRPMTYVCQTFQGDRFDLVATFTPEGR
jgi:hypothetical protein